MISSYLKIARRNIQKRKLYSFINAFGLSIGIAFCILIFLFIRDEASFDQWHVNKNQIYRINEKAYDTFQPDPAKPYNQSAWVQSALQPALKADLAEVAFATRFNPDATGIFRYGDKVFTENISFVDADFFHMFSFQLLRGNKDNLFQSKDEAVLTPAIAKKYFGDEDPLGKVIQIDVEGDKSYTVTGIIEAPPANSSIDFKILIHQENRPYYAHSITRWGNFNTPTFVQLQPGTDVKSFAANMEKLVTKYMGPTLERWRKNAATAIPADVKMFEYTYTRLDDVHLENVIGWHKASDAQYSMILGAIALLILAIACINYISLALTTSASRRMEVGIRKTVGAHRKQLIGQFSLESMLLAVLSMLLGLVLVVLFLPFFNQFTGKDIALSFSFLPQLFLVSLVLAAIVGLLAGSYPALVLSRFHPALVLKGSSGSRLQVGFTRLLVVGQFTLSACLIICSVIMYRQMRYITTKDLGYNKDQLIVIPTQTGWNPEADKTVIRFRNQMQTDPGILSVAGTTSAFNQGYSRYGYTINGEQKAAFVYGVDADYIPTMGIELSQGRNFDPARSADTLAVIVNEALVRDMKWTDPLNEFLNWREDTVGRGSQVIGVVKDYHFLSLERNIEPMFMLMSKKDIGHLVNIIVRIQKGEVPATLDRIRKAWSMIAPDKPFDFTFVDEDVAKQYEQYSRWMNIMGLSTGFAILISCLGLFGLAGINAYNRTKEIGIRKVMGADIGNIIVLLNRQYVWLSLIAYAIAAPAAWYLMNKWMNEFKFHITIGWELFALSMATGLFVALATVSYHAVKAATVNPAETLKYE